MKLISINESFGLISLLSFPAIMAFFFLKGNKKTGIISKIYKNLHDYLDDDKSMCLRMSLE